jgi:phenylacetate-coenzyme A ligase PaaK-like adenylate-forming protein
VLRTNSSTAVRVCLAAEDGGFDISGTTMRLSAEPFTPGKAAVIHRTGCTAASWYATGEAGIIGLPCSRPAEIDEVHLMADKLAMIRRERQIAPGRAVLVNVYSTLVPSVPKLMLNFVSDDYVTMSERRCGCLLETLGYTTHMHTIRSWEKLTSEGMSFIGHDLIRLIEEVLPARFGGTPADYQFVEDERDGLPKVDLLVSPRVGPVNETAVLATVLGFLDDTQGSQARRADPWRQANTVSVVRRSPIATASSKVLALHVMRGKAERGVA